MIVKIGKVFYHNVACHCIVMVYESFEMKVFKYGIIGLCVACCHQVFGQITNVPSFSQTSDTNSVTNTNNKDIYHDYAIAQAKQKWDDVENLNSEQQQVIHKIEAFYAKLDEKYQIIHQENHNIYEEFLKKTENQVLYQELNKLYSTDRGKNLPSKTVAFDNEIQSTLFRLPHIISTQSMLQTSLDKAIQKEK